MADQLEKFLQRRIIPEAPIGLSERIIAAALQPQRKRNERWSFDVFWQGFTELFAIPQPAYALSIALLLGFVFGITGLVQPTLADAVDEPIKSFGIADDSFEEGPLL